MGSSKTSHKILKGHSQRSLHYLERFEKCQQIEEYQQERQTIVPTKWIKGLNILPSNAALKEVKFPLATFETPLFYSVSRGAKISKLIGGIKTTVLDQCMTRSVLLEAADASSANKVYLYVKNNIPILNQLVGKKSKFTTFVDCQSRIVGNLLYLRLQFTTADASGHNMATIAAELIMDYLLERHPASKYISLSSNFCTDKKNSSVNAILGRGASVIAEGIMPLEICKSKLKMTPSQLQNLNVKKNLIGSIIAGGVQTANAHFANMLAAIYLPTGQDIANIVEGSQGITLAEVTEDGDLYFSVSCPNLIVGTVGNGKNIPFVKQNLEEMGCTNSTMLVQIICAIVWCGELSLLAALCNRRELTSSHIAIERGNGKFSLQPLQNIPQKNT